MWAWLRRSGWQDLLTHEALSLQSDNINQSASLKEYEQVISVPVCARGLSQLTEQALKQ